MLKFLPLPLPKTKCSTCVFLLSLGNFVIFRWLFCPFPGKLNTTLFSDKGNRKGYITYIRIGLLFYYFYYIDWSITHETFHWRCKFSIVVYRRVCHQLLLVLVGTLVLASSTDYWLLVVLLTINTIPLTIFLPFLDKRSDSCRWADSRSARRSQERSQSV